MASGTLNYKVTSKRMVYKALILSIITSSMVITTDTASSDTSSIPQLSHKSSSSVARTPASCCTGWSNCDNPEECCPVCYPQCVNGECTSPDVCTCFPGYIGNLCDKDSSKQFDVRLLHGKELHQGILQVRPKGGEWSFVHPNNWNKRNSYVACRQLGYSFALLQTHAVWKKFPESSSPMLNLKFNCTGVDNTLDECSVSELQNEEMVQQKVAIECEDYDPLEDDMYQCGNLCPQNTVTRTGCKCDPLCENFGDCCPDYFTNPNCPPGIITPIGASCTQRPLYHNPPFIFREGELSIGYYLVSQCTDSWVDDDVSRMCRNPSIPSDPFTFTPVQENLPGPGGSRKVYRNIFCAICNSGNLDLLQPWELHVLTINSKMTIQDVIPPKGTNLPRTCYPDLKEVIKCNYHDSIKDACGSYYMPWYAHIKPYRNIFCALCSDEYPADVAQLMFFFNGLRIPFQASCRDFDGYSYSYSIHGRVTRRSSYFSDTYSYIHNSVYLFYSYSFFYSDPYYDSADVLITPERLALFDFENSTTNNLCKTGELYDMFSQRCRMLNCLNGYRLVNGRCQFIEQLNFAECITYTLINHIRYNFENASNSFNVLTGFQLKSHSSAVLRANSTSFLSSGFALSKALGSWENASSELICNISSFLLVLENGENENGSLNCIKSKHTFGCVSTANLKLDMSSGIDTNESVQAIEYSWRENQNCYFLTVSHDICNLPSKSSHHCKEIILTSDEYEFANNSTAIILKASGKTISKENFTTVENGTVKVCAFIIRRLNNVGRSHTILNYVSSSCFIVSLLATFLTFLSYCIFKELRNMTGYVVMNFLFAVFIAQLMFLLAPRLLNPLELCISSAVISQFAWLAAFFWMNALSFVTTNTLTRNTVVWNKSIEMCQLLRYMAYAWGGPLLIVGVCISLHFCDCTDIAPIYGENNGGLCWLIGHDDYANLWGFAAPVAVLLISNCILFIYAVISFRKKMTLTESSVTSERMKMEIGIYIKLTILMGLPWLLGFVLTFKTNIYMTYIYTILNSLQGVFIFWALVLTGRAGKLWRPKLCKVTSLRSMRKSEETKPTMKIASTSFTISANSKSD